MPWSNAVAAEFLVPADRLNAELRPHAAILDEARRLARRFRVSTLVLLRRLHDIGHLSREAMWDLYVAELARLNNRRASSSGGGDFYRTQRVRLGQRFARAVIESTWEGRSSFTEANRLLNVKKKDTLVRLAAEVGLEVT
ncbi:MAG: Zn-dependent peptidase ImmA (M78 family) [Myxococcota bacterium]